MLCMIASTSAMAEWTLIDINESHNTYVDYSTIRKAGKKVKLWKLEDYKTVRQFDEKMKFLSAISQSEYDCKAETAKTIAFTWFAGNMLAGEQVYTSNNPQGDNSPIQPGSVGEVVWKIACGKK